MTGKRIIGIAQISSMLALMAAAPASHAIPSTFSHESMVFHLSITNMAGTVQAVSSIGTSCGCLTTEDIIGREIAPGAALPFTVKLNPLGMSGRLTKSVDVTLAPSGEIQAFPIEVVVLVRLSFDRRDAAFGIVSDDSDGRAISLRLRGTAAKTARIVAMEAPSKPLFRMVVAEDGGGVVVSLPPVEARHGLGAVSETWIVKTDDPVIPAIPLPVSALFEDRLSVVPPALAVASDEPVCLRTVLLRPNEGATAFKVLSAVTKPRPWGETTVTQRSGGGWMVRIEGADPDAVRQFSKCPYLEITTDMSGREAVIIPLRVVEGESEP